MSRRHLVILGLFTLCLGLGALFAVADEGAQPKSASPRIGPVQATATGSPAEGLTSSINNQSLKQQVQQELNLSGVAIQQIQVSAENGAPFEARVNIEGESYVLDMWPYSLRSVDFQLLVVDEAGIHDVFPPEPRTYRGVIRRADGSEVVGSSIRASMSDGKVTGMLTLDSNNAWFIESLAEHGLSADAEDHAVYRGDQTLPFGKTCGVDPSLGEKFTSKVIDENATAAAAARGTTFEVADIAIEADFFAYQDNGSSVPNTLFAVENLMNSVESVYEIHTNITYEVTAIVVRSSPDPYSSTNCGILLGQFENEWDTNFSGVPRDLAHLLTGRNLNDPCLGIAAVGVVCFTGFAYGLSENISNFNGRVGIVAHEIGHNWNACHCNDTDPPNCPNSPCHTMCASINGCNGLGNPPIFGPGSITTIVNYKNSAGCLFPSTGTLADPITLPFLDTFPNTVFNNTNWIFVDGGAINGNGVNEPSAAFSLNLDSTGPGEFDQNEVRTNFMLLAGQPPIDIEYSTEHRGVELNEELIVEYWSSGLTWENLNTISSTGVDQNNYVLHSHTITSGSHPDAFHDEFRLRFRVAGDSSSDDWYIDNVSVALSGADLTPPTPDPAEFAVLPPTTLSDTQIEFEAVVATDPSGVEYFFEKSFGPPCCGSSSSWQASETFIAQDLLANSSYSYKVKARDTSPNLNETALSDFFATGSTFIETPFDIALIDAQETEFTVTITCQDTGDSNRCVGGNFTSLVANPPSGLFLDMTPLEGTGSNVWTDQQTITITGLTPGTEYTFTAKARNRLSVETAFSSSFMFSTLGGGCPTTAGDIDQDGDVDGDDIAGYIRAKLGFPAEPGEEQACADFGQGSVDADTVEFVAVLLN